MRGTQAVLYAQSRTEAVTLTRLVAIMDKQGKPVKRSAGGAVLVPLFYLSTYNYFTDVDVHAVTLACCHAGRQPRSSSPYVLPSASSWHRNTGSSGVLYCDNQGRQLAQVLLRLSCSNL